MGKPTKKSDEDFMNEIFGACKKILDYKDITEDFKIKTTKALKDGTIVVMPSNPADKPVIIKNIGEYILKDPIFREGFKGTRDDGKYIYCWVSHYTPKDRQQLRKELWQNYGLPELIIEHQLKLIPSDRIAYNKHAVEVQIKIVLPVYTSKWHSLGFLPKEKGIDARTRKAIYDGKIDPTLPIIHKMTSHAPVKDESKWPLYNLKIAIPYGDITLPEGLDRKDNGYKRLADLII